MAATLKIETDPTSSAIVFDATAGTVYAIRFDRPNIDQYPAFRTYTLILDGSAGSMKLASRAEGETLATFTAFDHLDDGTHFIFGDSPYPMAVGNLWERGLMIVTESDCTVHFEDSSGSRR